MPTSATPGRKGMSPTTSGSRGGGEAHSRHSVADAVEDGLEVVAVEVEDEGPVVAGVVVRRSPGPPLSVPPAARAASWKASTCAVDAAASAIWQGVGFSAGASHRSAWTGESSDAPGVGPPSPVTGPNSMTTR